MLGFGIRLEVRYRFRICVSTRVRARFEVRYSVRPRINI